MVKKNKKMLIILAFILLILAVTATFFLIRNEGNMTLTQEQYQLLKDSILPLSLQQMNATERYNAWTILNSMRNIEFSENRSSGESGVSLATWILEMLNVGEIKDFVVVEKNVECAANVSGIFVATFVSEGGDTYYIWYHQTWGLQAIVKGSRNGEIVYDRIFHTIVDGRIVERE